MLTTAAPARPPDLDQLAAQYPGVAIVVTSALEGNGIEALRDALVGSTAVLLGESGAGKSTLANVLLGRDDAFIGDVRSDSKGRHTTTSRHLHVLDGGGAIINTPGIRAVGLWTDPDAIDDGTLSVDRHGAWRRLRREAASAELRASPREPRRRGKTFSRAAKLGEARTRGFSRFRRGDQ